MDRRVFLKSILAAPIITPVFLSAANPAADCEVLLINDHPQLFFPYLLKELTKYLGLKRKMFTFSSSSPIENELMQSLTQAGWQFVKKPTDTSLIFTFDHLRLAVPPSFTLVKNGTIRDIRTHKLLSLWKEMNGKNKSSTRLTRALIKNHAFKAISGKQVLVFKNSKTIETLSLKQDSIRSYETDFGTVSVKIEQGKARITAAACRHQICKHTFPIHLPGERIICAPSHFLLEIPGNHTVDTVIG